VVMYISMLGPWMDVKSIELRVCSALGAWTLPSVPCLVLAFGQGLSFSFSD